MRYAIIAQSWGEFFEGFISFYGEPIAFNEEEECKKAACKPELFAEEWKFGDGEWNGC